MRLPGALLIVASILGAVYAGGLFYEIDAAPPGCCGLSWPTPDPWAAERNLAKIDPKGLDAAAQRSAAVTVLRARPTEPTAWLRLAYADWLTHGGAMTEAGNRAFDLSYEMTPLLWRQTPWRITFALVNWSQLTPEGRKAALKEIELAHAEVALGEDWLWDAVRAAVRQGRLDPAGRMTAALYGLI